jgi:hypothetical protein
MSTSAVSDSLEGSIVAIQSTASTSRVTESGTAFSVRHRLQVTLRPSK